MGAAGPQKKRKPMFETQSLREELIESFSDEDLRIFCFDHYIEVYQQFGAGMTKAALVQLLLAHCVERGQLAALVELLRAARPGRFVLPDLPAPAPPAPAPPARPAARNPYTLGGVVRGARFYGRASLLDDLLAGNDRAVWIIGCRRIGKTSLLHRLKQLAAERGALAFFCNLEAADTPDELPRALTDDLDLADARLARLGLTPADLGGLGLAEIMRLLDRRARAVGAEVVMLCDEAESLLGLVEVEDGGPLRELRRALQGSEALRVVIAATKQLEELNDLSRDWDTSPFLFGVTPRFLGRLTPEETAAVIRQSQSGSPIPADDATVAAITAASGGHPFLTQWLCGERLWDGGALRMPTADDLIPDSALSDLFQLDYNHLSALERRILRLVAGHEPVTVAQLSALLDDAPEVQVRYLAQSLAQLCYVQREGEVYRVGNRLLHTWLQLGQIAEAAPRMSDMAATEMADEDQQRLTQVIVQHKRRLRHAEAHEHDHDPALAAELEHLRQTIDMLEHELALLRGARAG